MRQVTIDVQQRLAVVAFDNHMALPDFFKQCFRRHTQSSCGDVLRTNVRRKRGLRIYNAQAACRSRRDERGFS
jgi:hypothetical protein